LKATGTSAGERPAPDAERVHEPERPPGAAGSIGILGGTFNPPHRGHLAVARHALQELALEHVLLVPAHTSPYKAAQHAGPTGAYGGGDPGPKHRLRMCQLAFDGMPGLSVCAIEIERGGLSYTVDTLTSIHDSHPDAELTFIVGADTASTLSSWRQPAQLLELARLAVAARAGAAQQRVLDALAGVAPAARVSFLRMPAIAVSSSLVRERVAAGASIDELVGPDVAGYIAEHGLYRSAVASR
jgi:nicotinate-nucleotide adenylyltransferase